MYTTRSFGIILQIYTLAKSTLDTIAIAGEPVQNLAKAVFYFKKVPPTVYHRFRFDVFILKKHHKTEIFFAFLHISTINS